MVNGAPAQLDLAGVGLNVLSDFAAQQLVHRQTSNLALNVPHGNIQRADCCKCDGTTTVSPVTAMVQLLPNHLMFQRIHTNNKGSHLANIGHCGITARHNRDAGLAPATDTFIGIHANAHGRPARDRRIYIYSENINTCNFHGVYFPFLFHCIFNWQSSVSYPSGSLIKYPN